MKIRNDDISADTDLDLLSRFCDLCDKFNVPIIHAVTPLGFTHGIERAWSNQQIIEFSGHHTIADRPDLLSFLNQRCDEIAIHGLWHTHSPSRADLSVSYAILVSLIKKDIKTLVWPFNEQGEGLGNMTELIGNDRIEDYLPSMSKWQQIPTTEIVYLHEWRFDGSWYSLQELEQTFQFLHNVGYI